MKEGGQLDTLESGFDAVLILMRFFCRMATNRMITIAIITVLVLLILAVIVSKFR
jgi:hypothetical protein